MPLLFTRIENPRPGVAGLMVDTSNSRFASAAIVFGGGGGSGIAHAVSGVAFTRFRGAGPPCVQVPLIVLPSSFPSYVPPIAEIPTLTVAPSRVIEFAGI